MSLPRIMIIGVGNILLSDEGLGVRFVEELTKIKFPENVRLLEGGTAGLELVHLIQEVDFLIIVDAIEAQAEPGAIFRYQPEEFKVFPEQFQVSFHQVGIIEILNTANLLGHAPQTLILGVQPSCLEWGIKLSPEIQALFPRLSEIIMREVEHIQCNGKFA